MAETSEGQGRLSGSVIATEEEKESQANSNLFGFSDGTFFSKKTHTLGPGTLKKSLVSGTPCLRFSLWLNVM